MPNPLEILDLQTVIKKKNEQKLKKNQGTMPASSTLPTRSTSSAYLTHARSTTGAARAAHARGACTVHAAATAVFAPAWVATRSRLTSEKGWVATMNSMDRKRPMG